MIFNGTRGEHRGIRVSNLKKSAKLFIFYYFFEYIHDIPLKMTDLDTYAKKYVQKGILIHCHKWS